MRSVLIRLGLIGAIAGGAFLFRDFLPGGAANLAVGDCFDPPAEAGTVEEVPHHPCTESHGGEVVFVGEFEPATEAFPSDDEMFAFFTTRCLPAFFDYTGLTGETSQHLDISAFTPTEEGWSDGDRKVICFAIPVDGTPMTTSVRKAQ